MPTNSAMANEGGVERYGANVNLDGTASPHGAYVKWDAYAALQQQNESLAARLQAAEARAAKFESMNGRNVEQYGMRLVEANLRTEAAEARVALAEQRESTERSLKFMARDRAEAAEARCAELERDALRWRALIGSARVRVLGSAGLTSDVNPYGQPWNGYAHIGLELWTRHEPVGNEPSDAAQWLTKYADIAAALHGQKEGRDG